MSRLLLVLGGAIAALALALPATAGVSPGVKIYVDGVGYRTVGTPTDFTGTGAPDSTFQPIYDFGGIQPSVATAAPGDPGYRGGRWTVLAVSFSDYDAAVTAYDTNGSNDLDSWSELSAALAGGVGGAMLSDPGIRFECPVIPLPQNG